jgi:hypothetical protein
MTTPDTTVVTDVSISNTASGTTIRGEFEPNRDRLGKIIYSTGLKLTTEQVDRNFPAVLTADKVKSIVKALHKQDKTLLVEDGVSYRLTGKEVTFEAKDDLPASKVGFYRPIMPRVTVTI